jgi:hypothetical protein
MGKKDSYTAMDDELPRRPPKEFDSDRARPKHDDRKRRDAMKGNGSGCLLVAMPLLLMILGILIIVQLL